MILLLNDEGKKLYDILTPADKLKLVTRKSYNFNRDHVYYKLHVSPEGVILNHTRRIGRLIVDETKWTPTEIDSVRQDGLYHRISI